MQAQSDDAWALVDLSLGTPEMPNGPAKGMADGPIDMKAAKEYMQATFEAINRYLENLTQGELERTIQITPALSRPVSRILSIYTVTHLAEHAGEVSCIKGLRGLKGY